MPGVRILGRVEVDDAAADRALGGGQARELLGFLVAQRGTPAPTTAIVEALWGEDPPATVATIVHGLVRRVRKALGAEVVAHDDRGYRLVLPDDAVDLWALDARLAAGDLTGVRAAWRDPAFGVHSTKDWAQDAVAHFGPVLRPDPDAGGLLRSRRRVPVSRLVGRRRELAAVTAALRRSRLVTIVGLGGVGKTRLALEVLRQLDHPHVAYVDVGAAVGPAATRLAAELGLAPSGDPDRDLRATASLVGRRHQLLLLDGAEHDTGGTARAVELLVAACSELTVLATSRSALGVPGEHVVPLLPFAEPGDPRGDAVELLLDRAHGMGLAPTAEDRERAAEICRRCAGVPLAVELGVAEVVFGTDVIDDGAGRPATPEQAVTHVVAQALDKLSPATAGTARRAALLVAGFTPDLAAVLGDDGTAPTSVLHELVATGLVAAETAGPSRRLRFLDRVRSALVAEAADADRTIVRTAVTDVFARVRPDPAAPVSVPHLRRAVAELANAQGLLAELQAAGDAEARLELVTRVADTWAEDGQWASGEAQVAAAIKATPDVDGLTRARAVRAWAAVSGTYEGVRRITPQLQAAAAAAEAAGDLGLESRLRLHLANAYGYGGQLDAAGEQARRLGALGRELGSEYVQIGGASLRAMGRLVIGDPAGARPVLDDLARRLEELDAPGDAARMHRSSSLASRALADMDAACDSLERAEALALAGQTRGTLATVRTDLADLRHQLGNDAGDALASALEAVLAVGNLRAAGIIRTRLGALHGDPATIALGTLDLLHADHRWAAASLATLLDELPDGDPLHRLGPPAVAALAADWGTPLDAREQDRVAPYATSDATAARINDLEAHLTTLATSA